MQLTGSSSDFNRVSETAMTSGVLGARLFKIEDDESYDRSGVPLAGGKRRTRRIRKTRKIPQRGVEEGVNPTVYI